MDAISAVVDRFYDRVLDDPELSPFFERTNVAWLRKHLALYIAFVAGGPAEYRGRDRKTVHERLAIQPVHFDRVADHLTAALDSLDVSPSLFNEVIALVAPLKADIVTTSPPPASPAKNGASTMSTAPKTHVGPEPGADGQLNSLDFLRASLSNVQANVFLADTSFVIIYANDRAMETLRGIEDEIQKAFDVEVERHRRRDHSPLP